MSRRALSIVAMLWCVVLGCAGARLEGAYLGERPDPRIDPPESADGAAPVSPEAWGRGIRAPGAPVEVRTDPGELPELRLAGDAATKLPLEHTHVSARLSGFVAEVEVAQTFANPSPEPIEVVYVFPLPENSAVDRMKMVIGKRVIEAEIRRREEARAVYEQAKGEGLTTALLEEERPNVFTQSVANILPGSKIDVVIHYVQDLTYDAGEYEFVFPMVVGPRYLPGAPLQVPPRGDGTRPDTDRVPDASRVSPPYVGKGERSGHDISIEVVADAGIAVGDFETPTHEVVARRPADGTLRLTLAEKKALPNRDFVLRYRAVGSEPRAALFTSSSERGRFFSLIVHPPALDVRELVGEREIVFVVDVSGSMSGVPIALCKVAMRQALAHLQPVDTFNILTFSGSTGKAFPSPRAADRASIAEALGFVDKMEAGGGTEALDAIATALGPDVAPGRHRYVFFLTDGLVGNDDRIVAAAGDFVERMYAKGQRARVFGFGVGSSPNRSLIGGLSNAGRGIAVYASKREDPALAVNKFFRWIDRSVVRDLRIDWGDLEPTEVLPDPVPDLFASHPVILHGRFKGAAQRPIVVRGKVGDRPVEIRVETRLAATADAPRDVLGLLWARAQVSSLEDEQETSAADRREAIARLGLSFGLVTRYTSFVAVDRAQVVGDGSPRTFVQPLDLPEGIDVDKAGGDVVKLTGPLAGAPALRAMSDGKNHLDTSIGGAQIYAVQQVRSRRGCGCRVGDGDPSTPAWWLLGAAAFAFAIRARRRPGNLRHGGTCHALTLERIDERREDGPVPRDGPATGRVRG